MQLQPGASQHRRPPAEAARGKEQIPFQRLWKEPTPMTHAEFGLVTSRTVCVQVQSRPTPHDPMDSTPPGSSLLGFSGQED